MKYCYFINKIVNGVGSPTLIDVDETHKWFFKQLHDEVTFEDGYKGYILYIFEY